LENKKNKLNSKEFFISFFLRVGLSIVFLYVGIAAFLTPNAWIGFIPGFIQNIIPGATFLHMHSIFNILLAIWIMSNKKIFYASILASLSLLAIIVFNYSSLDIIFRDLAILFASLALAVFSYGKNKK